MNRIYIIGIVASGKTTLAKELSSRMGIPWYELDAIVHKQTGKGRVKQSPEKQMQEIHNIDRTGSWIFEGVYRDSYHELLEIADQIIFLDPPLWKRRYRIIIRFIKQKLRIEPCHYQPDLKMLRLMFKWTNDFEQNRKNFLSMLDCYSDKLIITSHPAMTSAGKSTVGQTDIFSSLYKNN